MPIVQTGSLEFFSFVFTFYFVSCALNKEWYPIVIIAAKV